MPCGLGYALAVALLMCVLFAGVPVAIISVFGAAVGCLAPARATLFLAWSPVVVAILFGVASALPHAGIGTAACRIDL